MPRIERIIPVLTVRNIKQSLDFYGGMLGFGLEWGGEEGETICSIARDGQSIMLTQASGGSPGCVWIGLEDDSLFEACKNGGVKIVLGPRNMPWAYEMKVADGDGNILWLGTEPKEAAEG